MNFSPVPTQDQVLESLKKIKFPGLTRDIVSFGLIKEIRIEGDIVHVHVTVAARDPEVRPGNSKKMLRQQCVRCPASKRRKFT